MGKLEFELEGSLAERLDGEVCFEFVTKWECWLAWKLELGKDCPTAGKLLLLELIKNYLKEFVHTSTRTMTETTVSHGSLGNGESRDEKQYFQMEMNFQ